MNTIRNRVLAGMRPTGRLHLGNYLGAAKGMLALQDDPDFDTLFTVVDIHATTTPYDQKTLKASARDVFIDYLSVGLDPEKSAITIQSDLSDLITQLSFYLSSVMSVARMQHLPTFKEKVKQHPDNVTMALLNYPLLMAADILIYKASKVPVGIDQEPHLEIAREVARKMNERFGTDFPEPTRFATVGEYVPSLLGGGKMSKSVEGSSIELDDNLDTIISKLKKAPTDSGRGNKVPVEGGVANLLQFVKLFEGEDSRKHYEILYTSSGIRYGDLKKQLAEAIFAELKPIQEKRVELEKNPEYIDKMIALGAKKSRAIAEKTVEEVKKKMGLG
ncbi:tryptophan--tRNA ligase [Patescibacteria group bacterium]|nr:tryptophan--tRNA ligase [Patescibacteria group bacterium]